MAGRQAVPLQTVLRLLPISHSLLHGPLDRRGGLEQRRTVCDATYIETVADSSKRGYFCQT